MFNMLSIGKKAIATNEKHLETTAHNIANANTPGYSRQRVIQQAADSITSPFGNVGTGVEILRIERMRDLHLDNEYRKQNSNTGYWDTMSQKLSELEKNVLETTEFGISARINNFFNSWESLANNPYSTIHRMDVIDSASQMTDAFKDLYRSIEDKRQEMKHSLKATADRINEIADELSTLVNHISQNTVDNKPANDLMDRYDLLIDELSTYGNVQVHHRENGTSSIYLGTDELVRNNTVNRLNLIEGENLMTGEQQIFLAWNDSHSQISGLTSGSIKAMNDLQNSILPDYQKKLDELVVQIAEKVNSIHTQGYNNVNPSHAGSYFFNPTVTGVMDFNVSNEVLSNPDFIATSVNGASGDNKIALMITDLRYEKVFNDQTLTESFADIVYGIGQDVRLSNNSAERSKMLSQQTDKFRDSVKGVSINEETANLLKYQQAYQAAAKIVSIADDMMKIVISLAK